MELNVEKCPNNVVFSIIGSLGEYNFCSSCAIGVSIQNGCNFQGLLVNNSRISLNSIRKLMFEVVPFLENLKITANHCNLCEEEQNILTRSVYSAINFKTINGKMKCNYCTILMLNKYIKKNFKIPES